MELAISFSELELPPRLVRALDIEFSAFEESVRATSQTLDRARLQLDLSTGDLARAHLHRELPSLELFTREAGLGTRCRVWRPPYGLVSPADRRWLEHSNLSDGRRSLPVPARFDSDDGWNDPTGADIRWLCAGLREVTAHIDERRDRVA